MSRLGDRTYVGRALADSLGSFRDADAVVLALPRGGVPVAVPIAQVLGAPLSVLVVRKLGVPGHEEYGFGAVGEGGVRVVDPEVVTAAGVSAADLERVAARENAEVERRVRAYRGTQPLPETAGRTVLLVDDGAATGGTMKAAVAVARELGARSVVVAVGCAPPDVVESLRGDADEVVALLTPSPFVAVGQWYEDFRQVTDDEVRAALN